MKTKDRRTTLKFIGIFMAVVLLLAGIRHLFDVGILSYDNLKATNLLPTETEKVDIDKEADESNPEKTDRPIPPDVKAKETAHDDKGPEITIPDSINKNTRLYRMSGKIWNYDECFADTQQQHIFAANKFGINPVKCHDDVLEMANRHEVLNIEDSPFFVLDKLKYSMPYLVPSAKELLNDISINFLDSLRSKGYKPYLPIVSSVLRTTEDVEKLRKRNRNATDDSCHSYGTTFDITYSRFMPLTGIPTPVDSAEWRSDELKLTLAEVLYDLRMDGKCFVKHERKQPCFHITVRY